MICWSSCSSRWIAAGRCGDGLGGRPIFVHSFSIRLLALVAFGVMPVWSFTIGACKRRLVVPSLYFRWSSMVAGTSATRMVKEKYIEMIVGQNKPMWRIVCSPDVSVQFLVQLEEYDIDIVVEMFRTGNVGYAVKNRSMIMLPLAKEDTWSMYALDMLRKILNVLDLVLTNEDKDVYSAKHGDSARHVLEGIVAAERAMDDGCFIDYDEWDISYNLLMHCRLAAGRILGLASRTMVRGLTVMNSSLNLKSSWWTTCTSC